MPARALPAPIAVLLVAFSLGCSDPLPPAAGGPVLDGSGDAQLGETSAETGPSGDADAQADAADELPTVEDTFVAQTDAEDPDDIDWSEFFDPPDTAQEPDVQVPAGPVGQLYAHTKDTLYRLDLAAGAVVLVGQFKFDKEAGNVTDMAVDEFGTLFCITHDDLFACDIKTAACKHKASLPSSFNGLTFVPKGTVDPAADALIGISDDGTWNRITITGTQTKISKLGAYGGGWLSSGDAFSVVGIGTYATLKGKGNSDSLALVDPKNGKLLNTLGETGVDNLFGLAWWAGVFYGFSSDGNVYTLDVQNKGKATIVKSLKIPAGLSWWGAGVSTRANAQP